MKPALLLVDDNEEILEFIADDLNEKYDVLMAFDGEEALHTIHEKSVHLVVSDIMMPVMDGFELCKQIKSDFHYSHIPVILLTAKDTMQSKMAGLELGADAYIEKPFSPLHLQIQIANLLSNRNKIKEHFANSPLVHINTIAASKADEGFLEKLNLVICDNVSNFNFDVEQLASRMNMSRPTLYRKIKAISDLTPNEFIHIARLKKATELLSRGQYRISEVAEMVGYTSQTQFGRSFLKQFGMAPSVYFNSRQSGSEPLFPNHIY